MERLKELISELFEVDLNHLHNIEVRDIEFGPSAKQEIGKTVGEMASLGGISTDMPKYDFKPTDGVFCQGFWIESTQDLVLYLWDTYQARAILLSSNNWEIRNDVTLH